jgi:hypothetical protein
VKDFPDLTDEFCLDVVLAATPSPSRFDKNKDDASVVTLFHMGVTSAIASALYAQGVKHGILPWKIDEASIPSARETTLQKAALAIPSGAFSQSPNAK